MSYTSYHQCHTSYIAAVGITFNVFNYDAVWDENQNYHFPIDEQMRYLLHHRFEIIRNNLTG